MGIPLNLAPFGGDPITTFMVFFNTICQLYNLAYLACAPLYKWLVLLPPLSRSTQSQNSSKKKKKLNPKLVSSMHIYLSWFMVYKKIYNICKYHISSNKVCSFLFFFPLFWMNIVCRCLIAREVDIFLLGECIASAATIRKT